MSTARPANRLSDQTSPYLLQHAHNPVDWYPWGQEALELARREDKPILLSIGYAACHWCHVMERESFEDLSTAAIMNERFVCIKVDREERPDLDAIYMDAVQAMTGSGGWPMTVFLAPDGTPFYAGTYFPKEDRFGMPAFTRVLQSIARVWQERRDEAVGQGDRVLETMRASNAVVESNEPLSEEVLQEAFAGLRRAFDPEWGGFGRAPKFPQPMTLEFVLRCHLRGYDGALEMLETTLDRMAAGGVYDQAGGGFHRYSTDSRWHVPHFEKMLYDNAQLARLYTRAWQVTRRQRYAVVARETLDYLLGEMRGPEGAFFSSQDADSDGVEGRFYVWPWGELAALAQPDVARYLGGLPGGNWEGTNVLWTPVPLAEFATKEGVAQDEFAVRVSAARAALTRARDERVRPATDDKVLASWNGLVIGALAEAGRAFGESRYVEAAESAAGFVLTHSYGSDGRLLRSWRDGRAGGRGYLDDYAAMAEACLTLYETTFELRWFEAARTFAEEILRLFRDAAGGGFFQTGSDAEELVFRPKEIFDNAVPSGNSIASDVLQRLTLLSGESEYERAGLSSLRLVREHMRRAPTGFGRALCALDLYLSGGGEVAVVGDPSDPGTRALLREIHGRFLPNTVIASSAPDDRTAAESVGLLRDRPAVDGRPTAYVCRRFVCLRPVTDPEALARELSGAA